MGSFNLRDRGTRGQISIILIFALPTLLGAMALCVDVGNLYLNRVRIQTATDAAVLAGANYLPDYKTQATATTQQYATANGIAVSEIQSIYVASDGKSMTMNVSRAVPCYFCAVLGM